MMCNQAGFGQVMQGRADRDRVRAAVAGAEEAFRRARPDVIGGIVAWPRDGTFTQVVNSTNEADARKGEQAEPSPEDAEAIGRVAPLMQVDGYVDLREPLLRSLG